MVEHGHGVVVVAAGKPTGEQMLAARNPRWQRLTNIHTGELLIDGSMGNGLTCMAAPGEDVLALDFWPMPVQHGGRLATQESGVAEY